MSSVVPPLTWASSSVVSKGAALLTAEEEVESPGEGDAELALRQLTIACARSVVMPGRFSIIVSVAVLRLSFEASSTRLKAGELAVPESSGTPMNQNVAPPRGTQSAW
jgi:hypothetical protein